MGGSAVWVSGLESRARPCWATAGHTSTLLQYPLSAAPLLAPAVHLGSRSQLVYPQGRKVKGELSMSDFHS